MDYFVNVFEMVDGDYGHFRYFRLISGDSPEMLKKIVINHMNDLWDNGHPGFKTLRHSTEQEFSEIAESMERILNDDYEGVNSSTIEISDAYTNPSKALAFYSDYLKDSAREKGSRALVEFSVRGQASNELEMMYFPIFKEISKYNIGLPIKTIKKLMRRLK
jgi:hypothetical protein